MTDSVIGLSVLTVLICIVALLIDASGDGRADMKELRTRLDKIEQRLGIEAKP